MDQKLIMEAPIRYEREATEDGNGYVAKINEGWIADDDEMFTRLLRKEITYYIDGKRSPDEPKVELTEVETIKGTTYLMRKLSGTLFDDVQP